MDNKSLPKMGAALFGKVRLKNALDTLLVATVALAIICVPAYVFTREIILLYIVAVPLIMLCIGFLYFMFKNPQMLRTEEHEQKMYQLSAGLGQKDSVLRESQVDSMEHNDAPRELTKGKGGKAVK